AQGPAHVRVGGGDLGVHGGAVHQDYRTALVGWADAGEHQHSRWLVDGGALGMWMKLPICEPGQAARGRVGDALLDHGDTVAVAVSVGPDAHDLCPGTKDRGAVMKPTDQSQPVASKSLEDPST